ncbi:hypothetical protein [Cyclobacterium plantarum]|uniref:Uncharacterized protein n=1 Tax=Cyclobacterium plantarum TaxID=2716263 RepID=A0ABX0H796_9BACT|nr:hypothetical protein [Cyclobacterium plantarum]NHE56297.1 hypothetical protein [Cyclobacterium plantarum]
MRYDSIDEILKKGLIESERINDRLASKGKSRVWEGIEKPKKSRAIQWGLISALAASVSLFLVVVLLMLKLATTQEELDILQAQIVKEMSPPALANEGLFYDDSPTDGVESDSLTAPIPAARKAPHDTPVQGLDLPKPEIEKVNISLAIPLPVIVSPLKDFQPKIALPYLDLRELIAETKAIDKQMLSEKKGKQPSKLKIRMGGGYPSHSQHQSPILHLKL